jgi:tetratricopeptide (TPR) repeat protein
MDDGVAAYREGRREAARRSFEAAAAADPRLSMARVYLGRLAREDGDILKATALLDTAIRLDTANAVAYREMGQLQLQANRPTLAVSFFRRALERNAEDRVAQGWMGCALTRSGDVQLAERFYGRAGDGDWTSCRQTAPGAVPPGAVPPGGVPGAPAGAAGGSAAPPTTRQPLTP